MENNIAAAQLRVLERLAFDAYAYKGSGWQLASGGTSTELIDCSRAFRSLAALNDLATCLAPLIPDDATAVAAVSFGGDPVAVACCLARPGLRWLSIRRTPKGRGQDVGVVTGPVRAGDRVLIVEDVLTTGLSALHAAAAFGEVQFAELVGVLAVVDRLQVNLAFRSCAHERVDDRCTTFRTSRGVVPVESLFTIADVRLEHQESQRTGRQWTRQ